ncbi:hypothetical protein OROMI_030447 [Orobanche minor]
MESDLWSPTYGRSFFGRGRRSLLVPDGSPNNEQVYIVYLCSDLWANYLNGTIPKEWASTKLEVLSLENNMFNRQVPASLGKLVNLVILVLNTNNLTGSVPAELSHLPKLKEMSYHSNRPSSEVLFLCNEFGQTTDKNGQSMSSFIGSMIKDGKIASLDYESWHKVPNDVKEKLWSIDQI